MVPSSLGSRADEEEAEEEGEPVATTRNNSSLTLTRDEKEPGRVGRMAWWWG